LEGNAYQKIYDMKRRKKEEHLIKGPLTNSIHSKKNCLEEEKEKPNADDLSGNHHEEVRPIGHLPHQANPYEERK
jgi:hypothetical protein